MMLLLKKKATSLPEAQRHSQFIIFLSRFTLIEVHDLVFCSLR